MIEEKLKEAIQKALDEVGVGVSEIHLEHPADMSHGDFSTNVAMVSEQKNPRELADKIVAHLVMQKIPELEKVEVAGPGFINFYLSNIFFENMLTDVLTSVSTFGKNDTLSGEKVMVEYTDPNVMKPFHIGHLMSNAIGETLSRLIEYSGAEVKRANYYSDAGFGIASAVYGMEQLQNEMPSDSAPLSERVDFLGKAYVHGVKVSEDNPDARLKIAEINKAIYEGKGGELYEKGKKWSLERFEEIYKRLDSRFDFFYPESSVATDGERIVREGLEKGVFEKGEKGAIVFDGEKHGLHTRVFINSEGLPTYEAKELGLTKKKQSDFNFDTSIVITANEQDAYFAVVLKAMEQVMKDVAQKTKHISHGMMRFADSKMSSRTGNVIAGEALIEEAQKRALEKMDPKTFDDARVKDPKSPDGDRINEVIAEQVAIGAIKYSILKQHSGKDIIFDMEQALSLEGDSGPYLQYTLVRAESVLAKAKDEKIPTWRRILQVGEVGGVEKLLYRFPEVVRRAREDYAPQLVSTYLIELASSFNTSYAQEKIVDKNDPSSPYKVALTEAVATVLKNGLWVLAIPTPERM